MEISDHSEEYIFFQILHPLGAQVIEFCGAYVKKFNFTYSRINPEDEAITIVNSENVSIGGARNISLKQQESESNGGEKSLLVPKVIFISLLIKTCCQRKVFSKLFTFIHFFRGVLYTVYYARDCLESFQNQTMLEEN